MELLKKLVEASGISGREERIRDIVVRELKPLVDDLRFDQMGNIIGFKTGTGKEPKGGRKKVMLAGHMDEIGFIVHHIDDNGYLRVQPLGGWDPRAMMAQRVTVLGKRDLTGLFGSKPIHILTEEERKKPLEVKDFFIDLGLPVEKVKELVEVGTPVTMQRQMVEVGNCYTSKTMDDRVGVYCMIEGVRKARKSPCDLYVVATVQEEVGLRGALAASSGIVPDVGIALDVTLANDVPGSPPQDYVSKLGDGTAIAILNGSHISNPRLFSRMVELAEKKKIKYQRDAMVKGGTDAGGIQRAPGGPAVITLSIPCRYVHTTVEMVHKDDVQATIDLLAAYLTDPGNMDYQLM
ncbi:MAG: M42 family metallopeptidase [Calditrichaeota bacterium]|nr:M42 family metallopeptidase [Calditrichota bacterium]